MGRWKTILFAAIALPLLGAAGYIGYYGFPFTGPAQPEPQAAPPQTVPVVLGDVRQLVSAPGQVNGTQQQELTMDVSGRIASVNVRPGDTVKKGQALASMADQSTFEAAASAAHLELLQAQQELEDLRANAPKATADAHKALIQAEDDLKKAQTKVEALKYPRASQQRLDGVYADYQTALQNVAIAQNRFDDVANLPNDDPRHAESLKELTNMQKEKDRLLALYNWLTAKPTEKDIAEANANLEQAQAVYDNAQRTWERVKNGPDTMQLDLAEAKVADKQQAYNQALEALKHLTLKAPFDGVITEIKAKAGEAVTASAVVMTLSNPGALEAQVTVVEEDYALIQPGLLVQLYFDAQPDAEVTGHVSRIVPARTSDTQPEYPVYIELDQVPAGLAPGMTVDASIVTAEKKAVLTLPKALVRARTDGTATVQVWANGQKQEREIVIGLIGDSSVEIVSGLQEGEQVVGQ